MSLRLAVLKSVFSSYNRYAFPLIMFFVVLVFLIVKNEKYQRNLLLYEIFGILLLVTPFIGNKIVTYNAGSGSNWTVYGILCVAPVVAYILVNVLQHMPRKKEQLMMIGLFLAVQMSFGLDISAEAYALPGENQKIFPTVIEMAENIDLSMEPYVMAPLEIAGNLREYESNIRVFYDASYDELQKNITLLQREAEYYGCNYIILEVESDNEILMVVGGYERVIALDGYVLYEKSSE